MLSEGKSMSNDLISERFKGRRWRVDAKLGIMYGLAFIFFGVVWQLFLSVFLRW